VNEFSARLRARYIVVRSAHQRYLDIFEIVQQRNREMARMFDDPRRSRALLMLGGTRTCIRVLKIYDVCNQKSAISFVDEVIRRLPFRVLVIQTDNGAEFQSNFHWHLEGQDIRHVYIRPKTPRLNGKVERSHRVDEQEFYQLLDKNGIAEDIHLFNDKLREWEDYYNYHRPHGALDGQTPYERLLARRASASVSPKS
jgi:transposase InsO family protein